MNNNNYVLKLLKNEGHAAVYIQTAQPSYIS